MTIKIIDYAVITEPREKTNKQLRQELKSEFGISGRRLDNFTLTAMKALANVQTSLKPECKYSLFSAAQYFSLELLQSLLLDLAKDIALKPLDFVATVGNAANYYLAKEFKLHGSNLFLGCSEQKLAKTLLTAELDLLEKNSDAAVLLLWHETETTRRCDCLIIELTDEAHASALITDINELTELIAKGVKPPFNYR
ncbi:hypothetical protein AAEU29_16120 [Pseudoalteromonas sp. SSM20]|uniref:hypothetical protein n=1 Tax=Pseudoalteromonas sp. SSM20 TaxID=3139394 RepID=UPI003BA9EF61